MTYPRSLTPQEIHDERINAATRAKIAREASSTEQTLRRDAAGLDLKIKAQQAKLALAREKKAADEATKAAKAKKKTAQRADKRAARRAAIAGVVEYVRTHTVAVYCGVIYGAAVAVAVIGQISMASLRGWPIWVGVLIALFVEGIALSMALTGHEMRLQGERAIVPRALTWVASLGAASINYAAHIGDPVLAVVYAAGSLAGITVWEVRSAAKHRTEMRAKGLLPDPPVRFGPRRWLRYPVSTFRAWSLDIRDRVGGRAGGLLARASGPGWWARKRSAKRQHKVDLAAATSGAPIFRVEYFVVDTPSATAVPALPDSMSRNGTTRQTTPRQTADQSAPVRTDQTTSRSADEQGSGPALRAVGGPIRSAAPVGEPTSARSVRPVRSVHAVRSGSSGHAQSGPTALMTEVFEAAVADGVLIGHLTMRDRAFERFGQAIDPSFAKRLHTKLVDALDADVRAGLREEAA